MPEWESTPEGKLAIPAELRAAMRFRFSVYMSDRRTLHGRCAGWDALPGGAIRLQNVLSDTSDVPMGVMLRQRVTHRAELIVAGAAVIVALLNADELEAQP